MRRALAWFFGPKQPASKRERSFMIFLALVGLALIVLNDFHSVLHSIGIGLLGGGAGAALGNRGFRSRPRNPNQ
jgi:drug/metabolite transporter (DMT)-like permease